MPWVTYELPIDSGQVARFVDIATFMRAPRIADLDRVDIGLFGIPFDLGPRLPAGLARTRRPRCARRRA